MADDRKVSCLSTAQCLKACVFFVAFSSVYGSAADSVACLAVKETYRSRGFDENHVPMSPVSGTDLTICPQGKTCCTRSMESNMKLLSSKDHVYQIEKASKLTRKVFASRTRKFDEFFTELMDTAQKELHEMYLHTYGLGYQQNAVIFSDLFDSFRDYYRGKDKNLMEVMNNFFISLFRRMLQLLNTNYDIDDEYLECATEYMNALKPFADVPVKLSSHVNRGFIAARTFVQGLAVGRDVVNAVVETLPSEPCVKAIVRMQHCPLCRGLTATKPCNNYCLNTMKGCLAHHADLNPVWNEYIDAMESLANKLEGPFNIESVVNPINLKLSDAIMNMQTSASMISAKVFAGCGTPRLRNTTVLTSRVKRDAAAAAAPSDFSSASSSSSSSTSRSGKSGKSQKFSFDMGKHSRGKPGSHYPTSSVSSRPSLHRLVRDIRVKIRQTKDFWINLPHTVCNGDDVADVNDNDCWNGHDRAKYIEEVQKDGSLQQINNPEVEVDVTKPNTVIQRQKIQTKLIISKLHHAIKGEDVDWVDTEIEFEGLASGSGSGDSMTDGSGSGGYSYISEEKQNGVLDIDDSNKRKETPHRGGKGGHGHDRNTNTQDRGKIWREGGLDKDTSKVGQVDRTDKMDKGPGEGAATIVSQASSVLLLVLSIRGIIVHLLS